MWGEGEGLLRVKSILHFPNSVSQDITRCSMNKCLVVKSIKEMLAKKISNVYGCNCIFIRVCANIREFFLSSS